MTSKRCPTCKGPFASSYTDAMGRRFGHCRKCNATVSLRYSCSICNQPGHSARTHVKSLSVKEFADTKTAYEAQGIHMPWSEPTKVRPTRSRNRRKPV